MGALVREPPFEAKISLCSLLRMRRDDWDKQGAFLDLLPYALVPGVTAPKLALVEPYFKSGPVQGPADAPGGLGILRGIAEEDCPVWGP
jgi:hypothetical protein